MDNLTESANYQI